MNQNSKRMKECYKDIDKFLNNIEIIEKDLISIFKKNRIEKIDTKNKKIFKQADKFPKKRFFFSTLLDK